MRKPRLDDSDIIHMEETERKYNCELRRRRSAAIAHYEPLDIIAHYDALIEKSDNVILALNGVETEKRR